MTDTGVDREQHCTELGKGCLALVVGASLALACYSVAIERGEG